MINQPPAEPIPTTLCFPSLIYLSVGLSILFCCHSKPGNKAEDFDNGPRITLNLNEEKRFALDSILIQSFMFSPLEVNHLYVFSYNGETYDLNLETEQWINLKSRWGKYSSELRSEFFYHDPFFPNNLWIANFRQGLIAYNNSKEIFAEFPLIKPVSTIEFTEKHIWIGTWKGLYKYDRVSQSMHLVDKVAEIYIHFVTPNADGTITINNEFRYEDKTNALEKLSGQSRIYPVTIPYPELHVKNIDNQEIIISKPDTTQLITFPYAFQDIVIYEPDAMWIPTNELHHGLLRVDRKKYLIDTFNIGWEFRTVHTSVDSKYFWVGNSLEALAINKSNGEVLAWHLPEHSRETIDYQDSKYLYSRDGPSIIIRPKNSVLAESIPLNQLIQEEKRYIKLLDSTRVSWEENIRILYKHYKQIKNEFATSGNSRILQGIEQIRNSIAGRIPYYAQPFDYSLITFLDSIDEPDIRGAVAAKLIIASAQKGMMETAVGIDTTHIEAITDRDVQYYQGSVRKIHESKRSLDSLNAIPMDKDERLWKTANVYYNLFGQIGPFTEASSVRMDYAFTYLNKLLTQFPESTLADNAEYMMITHEEEGSHEGGDTDYNPEAIKQYNRFLKKYPASELIPNVYLKFISLHYDYGVDYYEKEKYLLIAKGYVDQFYAEFPNHPLRKEVEYFETYINYDLPNFGWNLNITLNDTPCKLNSPILIRYTLTNQSTEAKTISVYKQKDKYSSFFLNISPIYDQEVYGRKLVEFTTHPEQMQSIKQDTIIQPGQVFSETTDITKWVDHDSYGQQGYYRILHPGKYELWALFKLESRSVPSNKIKIEIIE